jgi:hypothetical protein
VKSALPPRLAAGTSFVGENLRVGATRMGDLLVKRPLAIATSARPSIRLPGGKRLYEAANKAADQPPPRLPIDDTLYAADSEIASGKKLSLLEEHLAKLSPDERREFMGADIKTRLRHHPTGEKIPVRPGVLDNQGRPYAPRPNAPVGHQAAGQGLAEATTNPWMVGKPQSIFNWAASELVDKTAVLTTLSKQTNSKVHELFQLVPGAIAKGQNNINRYIFPTLKTLKTKSLSHLEDYMVLHRAEVLRSLGRGLFPEKVRSLLAGGDEAIIAKVGKEEFDKIKVAAEVLWKYNDDYVLPALLNEGGITKRAYTALINKRYIPWQREEFADVLGSGKDPNKLGSVSDDTIRSMSAEGSILELDKPLENMLRHFVRVEQFVAKNKAARSLVDALVEMESKTGRKGFSPTHTKFIEHVRSPGVETMRRNLNLSGGKALDVAERASEGKTWGSLDYLRDGEHYVANIPALYSKVARQAGEFGESGRLMNIGRALTAPVRGGAVTYQPLFTPINILRDAMSGFYREKLIPFGFDYFVGMWSAIRKNDLFYEVSDAGAMMSSITETMTMDVGQASKIRFGALTVKRPMDAVLVLPRLIAEVNKTGEIGLRLAAWRKLKRIEGIDDIERAVRTRDVSVDFAKSGHFIQGVNHLVPFMNAATQGTINIGRTAKDNPRWAATAGAIFNIPTVISRVNNMQFETSSLIPDYEYTRHWVLQFAESTDKDGKKSPLYIKIPKGEIAGMFTFPAEALFSLGREKEDRSGVELVIDAGRAALANIVPVTVPHLEEDQSVRRAWLGMIPPVGTLASISSNRDLFTNRPIDPLAESEASGYATADKFGPETNVHSIWISRFLQKTFKKTLSPRELDFLVKDMLAGAGESSNWLLGMALEALGVPRPRPRGYLTTEEPDEPMFSGIPGVTRFVNSKATQRERIDNRKYYDLHNELNAWFNKNPIAHGLGVAITKAERQKSITPAGNDYTRLSLSPLQAYQYQKAYADLVYNEGERLTTGLIGDEGEQKEEIQRRLRLLKYMAWGQFLETVDPDTIPEEYKPAVQAERTIRASGYRLEDVVNSHPDLRESPEITAHYYKWRSLVGRGRSEDVLRVRDPDSLFLIPRVRKYLEGIDRWVKGRRDKIRIPNPGDDARTKRDKILLDMALASYGNRKPLTVHGRAAFAERAIFEQKIAEEDREKDKAA